jgi:hypothetical protein
MSRETLDHLFATSSYLVIMSFSFGTNHLVELTVKLSIVSSRAFPVAGPKVRNDLRTRGSYICTFTVDFSRQRLKTFLFLFLLSISRLLVISLALSVDPSVVFFYLGHFKIFKLN